MLISEILCNKISNIILYCRPPKHLYILIPSGWIVNRKLCNSANIMDLMASSSGNHMQPWYLTCPYSSIEKTVPITTFLKSWLYLLSVPYGTQIYSISSEPTEVLPTGSIQLAMGASSQTLQLITMYSVGLYQSGFSC